MRSSGTVEKFEADTMDKDRTKELEAALWFNQLVSIKNSAELNPWRNQSSRNRNPRSRTRLEFPI